MLHRWLPLLLLAASPPAVGGPAGVTVPLSALPLEPASTAEAPPADLPVQRATIRLEPGEESRLTLDLDVQVLEPGWVDLPVTGGALAVAHARLDGLPVALTSREDGRRWLTTRLDGAHHVQVHGSVATPGDRLVLPLPRAARTRVIVTDPGWDIEVSGGIPLDDGSVLLPAGDRLEVSWRPAAPAPPKPRVLTVQSATAVSFDESGLRGHTTLRYRAVHGPVNQVRFALPGRPDSVEVTGPAVRDHTRSGDRVTVRLDRPVEGAFELQVAFRVPPPDDADPHPAPVVLPQGVNAHTGWLTLSRAHTAMLVPEPHAGLEPVARSTLPPWATGLVPGTPIVSYTLTGRQPRLDYRLLRYEPVSAPPTVVDEARYRMATTGHGRVLLQARYQVRNDRSQYLHLVPPEGFRVLGVRVAGRVRQPVADPRGSIFIPLEKSVESLTGLISFPVEVYLLGKERAWARRGRRTLRTPAVNAPVAVARWELWLPRHVRWREVSGSARRVEEWTASGEQLTYGRGHRSAEPAEPEPPEPVPSEPDSSEIVMAQARARRSVRRTVSNVLGGLLGTLEKNRDLASPTEAPPSRRAPEKTGEVSLELFNQALQAYNTNDFDRAARYLDQSLQLDPTNASAQALMDNVAVLTDRESPQGAGDDAQARRVRALAQARTVDTRLEQKATRKQAEQALRAGDLEAAERELERLEEMTEDLSRLEQKESVEQDLLLEETRRQLTETRNKLAKKGERAPRKSDVTDSWNGVGGLVGTGGTAAGSGSLRSRSQARAPTKPAAPQAEKPKAAPEEPSETYFVPPSSSLPPAPQGVQAAYLMLNVPETGERLAFEQLLLAENEPLTIDIRYRNRRRP